MLKLSITALMVMTIAARTAVQAAADRELVDIGGNNKLLESVVVIAPLLGILGTAGGLITTFIQ